MGGSVHNITWTSTGTVPNVKLEYSADNGGSWTTAIASTANDGSEPWTLPFAPSTQYLVRASDASNASICDVSDAVFTIIGDGTEPNDDSASASVLPMGTTENLIFTDGDIDWHKFFVPAAEAGKDLKVNVRVTSPYPDPIPEGWRSDLDFELLDETLKVRGVVISGSDNETLYLPNVTSGWYYICIGYSSTVYADSTDYGRYAVTLEANTNFGLGYISGRVVDGAGQGVEGVFAALYTSPVFIQAVSYPIMTTGAGGAFTLAFIPGTYNLFFTGDEDYSQNQPAVNVVNEYYPDKKRLSDAEPVSFAAGQTLALGDVVLDIGAIVSGRATDVAEAPLPWTLIASYDLDGIFYNRARTDGDGNYTIYGVPIGGAKIRFSRTGYALEFYNDKPSYGSGDVLATQSGVTIPNIHAQLTIGGSISGTVSNGQGTGLTVPVRLYSVLDAAFSRAGVTSVTGSGAYVFNNVKPGDYKVFFNAAGTAYASEWYADAASFATATIITVTEGNPTTGINGVLAAPEINLKQGATDIATGGTYAFGSKVVGTDTDTVFTIENTGTDALNLTGLPLVIGGTNADQFAVTVQPVSPVAAAGSTSFTVRFHPTSDGDKAAQISIASNDGDEHPYVLNLTGTGAVPPATLTVTSPNGGESLDGRVGPRHHLDLHGHGPERQARILRRQRRKLDDGHRLDGERRQRALDLALRRRPPSAWSGRAMLRTLPSSTSATPSSPLSATAPSPTTTRLPRPFCRWGRPEISFSPKGTWIGISSSSRPPMRART